MYAHDLTGRIIGQLATVGDNWKWKSKPSTTTNEINNSNNSSYMDGEGMIASCGMNAGKVAIVIVGHSSTSTSRKENNMSTNNNNN